jgi:hypothetical protein
MAQRQFRSDDSDKWNDRYGNGSDGAYSPSTGTDSLQVQTCTGTSGGTALTATTTGFSTGDLILIHQTQGTGAGNWELNKISNITGFALAYNLINTYVSGAQVIKLKQYSSANIGGGVTITGQAWNGSTGGIYGLLVNGSCTIAGTLTINGAVGIQQNHGLNQNGGGFRGGGGSNDAGGGGGNISAQGESETGTGGIVGPPNNWNGSGGGGGQGGAGHGYGGRANQATANLTANFLFGGGAGGANSNGGTGGAGGNGGGIVFIIARNLTVTGSITSNGGNGIVGSVNGPSQGGAGGSILLKGQTITLGSSLVTANGGAGTSSGGGDPGGAGGGSSNGPDGNNGTTASAGSIHADYGLVLSGTTSPSIDSTKDVSLADAGGSFLFNLI